MRTVTTNYLVKVLGDCLSQRGRDRLVDLFLDGCMYYGVKAEEELNPGRRRILEKKAELMDELAGLMEDHGLTEAEKIERCAPPEPLEPHP